MNLHDMLKPLHFFETSKPINEIEIKGLKYDSRQVKEGDLFFCIPGFKTDGHLYADKAIKSGAVALVVERYLNDKDVVQIKVENAREAMSLMATRFYNYPSNKLGLIGVTGTNGKTTTTYLIKYILEESHKVGIIGTIGNMIGEKSLPASRTTPEAIDLQYMFSQMLNEKASYSIMEVSSHALDLKRVNGSSFDVGVYTNLSQDHMDFHESIDTYKKSKGILFEMIGSYKKDRPQYAVINRDDTYYEYFKSKANVPVYTYGIDKDCDFKAKNINVKSQGVSFDLVYPKGSISIKLKMTGLFNVYNSLAAFVVGYFEGVKPNVIKERLEAVKGVPGRFEKVDGNQDFTVIVDYAHTPDSLINVLTSAQRFVKGRIITVFGCGGDRDKTKRPLMGEAVAKYSTYSIVTSDNPRSEEPEEIITDILTGLNKIPAPYEIVLDRKQAIGKAIQMAQKDDLILIAGKGHETYQEIKGEIYPFDDKEIAKEFLEKLVE